MLESFLHLLKALLPVRPDSLTWEQILNDDHDYQNCDYEPEVYVHSWLEEEEG